MALISKTGITTGGTIEAEHITRAIDALSGGSTDSVSITGSLQGSVEGTASYALYSNGSTNATASAINAINTTTGGGPWYPVFVSAGGTTSIARIDTSTLSYNATTNNLTVTASNAMYSEYALTGGTVTQVNSQAYSNIGGSPVENTFRFLAGKVRIVSNTGSTGTFSGLVGKTLGTNVWVTATIQGTAASFSNAVVTVKGLTSGVIQFESLNVADGTDVHYHVIYIP